MSERLNGRPLPCDSLHILLFNFAFSPPCENFKTSGLHTHFLIKLIEITMARDQIARKIKAKAGDQVDWNSFVHQPDSKVKSDLAGSTKQNLGYVQHNFQKWIHTHVMYNSLTTNLYS
jgi:hypothetical protein